MTNLPGLRQRVRSSSIWPACKESPELPSSQVPTSCRQQLPVALSCLWISGATQLRFDLELRPELRLDWEKRAEDEVAEEVR